MLLGLAMVVGSGWLIFRNHSEDQAAGAQSDVALVEIKEVIAAEPKSTPAPTATPEPGVRVVVLPTATPVPEMPTMDIDGRDYIGYLEMPTIGISLPVMSDWSYPLLRIAPCR